MSKVWQMLEADFVWGDLPPDEEAARIAAKHQYKGVPPGATPGEPCEPVGDPPADLVLQHPRGGLYQLLVRQVPPTKAEGVGYLVTRQYGVRSLTTGVETWAPLASEGPTRPDITVGVVRDLCGIIALEQRVASQEAQIRTLQSRVSELEQGSVRVGVRR